MALPGVCFMRVGEPHPSPSKLGDTFPMLGKESIAGPFPFPKLGKVDSRGA